MFSCAFVDVMASHQSSLLVRDVSTMFSFLLSALQTCKTLIVP